MMTRPNIPAILLLNNFSLGSRFVTSNPIVHYIFH